jgi:hypothetical protein
VESVFARAPAPSLVSMGGVIQLIAHSICASEDGQLTRGLLLFLASMMKRAFSSVSSADFTVLKEHIFSRSDIIGNLLTARWLTDVEREGRFLSFRGGFYH